MSFKTSPNLLSTSAPVLPSPTEVDDVLDVSPPPHQSAAPIKQEMDDFHGMPSVSNSFSSLFVFFSLPALH